MEEKEPRELQSDAGTLVSQGATLMRVQNETMFAVSIQRPRDEDRALQRALADLDKLVPKDAEKAFYSIKYTDHATGRITLVTGPSIEAAVGIMRRWGNASAGTIVLKEDATGWDLEGYYVDLENPTRIGRPFRASKLYRPKKSNVAVIMPHERQLQAFQAGVSKAMRNAILEGLPKYVVSAFDAKARKIAAGGKELNMPAAQETREAIIAAFAKWGISQSQLETYIEKPITQWTGSHVADLRGLWNAIHDEQLTVEEVFSEEAAGAEPAKAPVLEMTKKMADENVAAAAATQTAPEGAKTPSLGGPAGAGAEKPTDLAGVAPAKPPETPERIAWMKQISQYEAKLALKPKVRGFLWEKFLGPHKDTPSAAPDAMLAALTAELEKLAALVK